ncbi:MarR family winged helix-turn-helix transcriptional regulator [Yoonia vestfoldensis]|jgi:DNA-binding MarR family transcriptional regulator|uniref:Winged helix DNA-binding domain protein n=1 Tax=Yoonia vestfoldensis TaxID=245188 RepID=A0A1Y0EDH3_9RHOB|nr:winged helix DNA-binding protein [Yoonia vestfoldensis]ARU01401.1 winged helix DNA-binding domain protein [Yoonia vestfoldensis]
MSVHTNLGKQDKSGLSEARSASFMASYLDVLTLVERLHRLLLDVIKDEFERVGILEINAVQALLLFNIADHEVTAGELKSRGYYQGSNVSYNLKKLVDLGYMHHQRSEIDRRSVRVRLTEKGRNVRLIVAKLFATHADGLLDRQVLDHAGLDDISAALRRVERYWSDQIRYIY